MTRYMGTKCYKKGTRVDKKLFILERTDFLKMHWVPSDEVGSKLKQLAFNIVFRFQVGHGIALCSFVRCNIFIVNN